MTCSEPLLPAWLVGMVRVPHQETFMSRTARRSHHLPTMLREIIQLWGCVDVQSTRTLQVCSPSCDCVSSCAGAAPVLADASAATGPAAVAAVRQQGLDPGSQAKVDVQGNGQAAVNGKQQHGQAAAAAATALAEPDAGPGDLAH